MGESNEPAIRRCDFRQLTIVNRIAIKRDVVAKSVRDPDDCLTKWFSLLKGLRKIVFGAVLERERPANTFSGNHCAIKCASGTGMNIGSIGKTGSG